MRRAQPQSLFARLGLCSGSYCVWCWGRRVRIRLLRIPFGELTPPRLLIPCVRMSLPNIQSRCSPGCLSEPMISSHRACSAHLPRSGVCGFSVCLVRAFVCVPAPFYVYSILLASSSCMLLFLLFLFRCTAPTMFLRRICCIVLCWAQCCSYYGVSHTP